MSISPRFIRILRTIYAKVTLDILAFLAALFGSFLIRYPIENVKEPILQILPFVPIYIIVRVGCFAGFRLYKLIWRYTGTHALNNIIKATSVGTVFFIAAFFFFHHEPILHSIIIVEWLLVIFFTSGLRIFVRMVSATNGRILGKLDIESKINGLIYGAGDAGELLLRSIETSQNSEYNIVGFIDDNKGKQGKYIHSKKVLGNRSDIAEIVKKFSIDEIYLSIPTLSGSELRKLLEDIKSQVNGNIVIKTVPKLTDLVSGKLSVNKLRKIEIKDLLRRSPVSLDVEPVREMIKGKNVMVVGGGGSIGFELCHQIAQFNPNQIIIVDSSEFNTYQAEARLLSENHVIRVIPLVADAGNEVNMRKIFEYYQPEIVFHSAAYKHVPMMELNPWAAVQNNLACTLVLTKLAAEFFVDRFVFISSDKAVRPTSVMGATKRICELITLYHSQNGGITKFMTVRFGNVLGSSGSVTHKFQEQINSGGPITVTHPEITRYFMLASEAVELVLQAGARGEKGHVYVLDMGDPVRIADLAKYMIELSGLKLDEDIKIDYIGLRPGEKLYEDLLLIGKEKKTKVPNIFLLESKVNIDKSYFRLIENLMTIIYRLNHEELRENLKILVPEYKASNMIMKTFTNENRFPIKLFISSVDYRKVN